MSAAAGAPFRPRAGSAPAPTMGFRPCPLPASRGKAKIALRTKSSRGRARGRQRELRHHEAGAATNKRGSPCGEGGQQEARWRLGKRKLVVRWAGRGRNRVGVGTKGGLQQKRAVTVRGLVAQRQRRCRVPSASEAGRLRPSGPAESSGWVVRGPAAVGMEVEAVSPRTADEDQRPGVSGGRDDDRGPVA